MIGARSKKILKCNVSSKLCMTCHHAERKQETPKTHLCPKNYCASSKAMEADAALTLYLDLFESSDGTIALDYIVADDDCSMRAKLRHHTSAHKTGSLPDNIPEPSWLADPSHRCKVAVKPIFALASLGNQQSECTNVDVLRIKKYWGYMIKMYRNTSLDEIRHAAKQIVEHLFNNHDGCDPSWCKPRRQEINKQKGDSPPGEDPSSGTPTGYYWCKEKHQKLYEQIVKAMETVTSDKYLVQCLH